MEKSSKKKTQIPSDSDILQSEVEEYLYIRQQRRHILPLAALVGLVAGLTAVLFRDALTGMDALRNLLYTRAHEQPVWGWIFPVLFTVLSSTTALIFVRRFAPEAGGSGIPHLEAVLQRLRELDWKRVLPVKFLGGVIAIGSGLVVGREGPTIQMGGAVGDMISKWLKVSSRDRSTLIAAGAGAGLAAAFNAPLSGLIFVLEEVQKDFQPIVFGAAFLAAAIADIVARLSADASPVFVISRYPTPPLASLPAFAVLGMIAGVLGVLFNKSLIASLNLYERMKNKVLATAVTAGVIGLIGWFSPLMLGSGHQLTEMTLTGKILLTTIPLFFVTRYVLTVLSYGTGVPGGIFAPLLGLGALIGLGIGKAAQSIAPDAVPIPAVFAVVGMAAYFTAVVRAPLTGIVLIIEMTGDYEQMLPLLISCFFAYVMAEALKNLPIYETLLERDLEKGGHHTSHPQPIVMDFTIKRGAAFDGQLVQSLNLPVGCILVRCTDGKREWVPHANTRLAAHMKISAVIAPEATDGAAILKRGCEAPKVKRKPVKKEVKKKQVK